MAFASPVLNPHPARARRTSEAPALPRNADVARGRILYVDNCASCHGPLGQGDGPGAAALVPRPANLAEHEYALARLADALWNGAPGNVDAGVARSKPGRSLVDCTLRRHAPYVSSGIDAFGTDGRPRDTRVQENCVQCHGVSGGGDGPAIDELRVLPTNFRRVRPSLAESLRALRNGVDGTQMAPWTDRLNDAELVAVAHVVRTFFDRGTQVAGAAGQ